jgi:hypothetical protein
MIDCNQIKRKVRVKDWEKKPHFVRTPRVCRTFVQRKTKTAPPGAVFHLNHIY